MCLYYQAPDEAAESANLKQSVSIAAPEKPVAEGTVPEKPVAEGTVPEKPVAEETVPEKPVAEETEKERNLPEWSEKVASGILTGEVTLDPAPKICLNSLLFLV